MKRYIQIAVVFALVMAVGLAKSESAWAGMSPDNRDTIKQAPSIILRQSSQPSSITITQSGIYNIGGICTIDVNYKLETGLKDLVDIDVPASFSSKIPFGYEGDLYLPGCHIVHYKDDEIKNEMSGEDGSWEVCFAERPDIDLTVYYYHDAPFANSQVWIELETRHEDGLACAPAFYTGEYTVGSDFDEILKLEDETLPDTPPEIPDGYDTGSVLPPPPLSNITESGTYSVGGICTFSVLYHEPDQTNEVHVADALRYDSIPVDDYDYSEFDEFPKNTGLLYVPGCHVLHYTNMEVAHWEKHVDQGDWEICFAAQPGKEMTIFYYLGDLTDQASSWAPLETTVEEGEACAPAFFTGVYVPSGKQIYNLLNHPPLLQ